MDVWRKNLGSTIAAEVAAAHVVCRMADDVGVLHVISITSHADAVQRNASAGP